MDASPRPDARRGETRCGVFALVAALLFAAAPAIGAEEAAPPGERETAAHLQALIGGSLPEEVAVASLFAVRLDRLPEVEGRIAALRQELVALEQRLAEFGSGAADPMADLGSLQLRREANAARLVYLEALAAQLRAMPEASRRILPASAEPRTALREHATALLALADALTGLAERSEELALRLESGALVGFRGAARDLAMRLDAAAEAFRTRSARLREGSRAEFQLADSLEAEARALRRAFFVTLLAEGRSTAIDALFLQHVEEQRRLQRATGSEPGIVDRATLAQLTEAVSVAVANPRDVGTVALAARLEESLGELAARADALIEAHDGARAWRLAFENEVVTILSGLASPTARSEAYALTSSLLRDVRAEAGLAWDRLQRAWSDPKPENRAFLGRAAVDILLRVLGLAGVVGIWWLARRFTGRFVTRAVHAVARAARQRFGIRVGTMVRLSGLLQASLPTLLAYPALRAGMAILGTETTSAALLHAIGMPLFWYALGLQGLLGATRRITWGRPALIEVSSATLPELRRTYVGLGLVVAIAAVLRAVARVVIGEGVIVRLVDGTAILWVGVWAAWEAVHWRGHLAKTWMAMLPDGGANLERRGAGWMERSRLGFVLSPYVVVRGLAGWVWSGLVALSKRTDLADILAARRLRRAAKSEDAPAGEAEVPDAYLREFPLRPILGEDDALLLPRDETVDAITGQIARWRESKGEGSIALVGEKGAGKTTLAALVAREVSDLEVVQHTLRGKPADAAALFRDLSPSLPVNGAADFEEWIEGLCAGPERLVLLDESHNVFLRTVGGYRAYDALVDLVNATSDRLFWVLLFNSFTWRFLNESRSRLHYFRKLIRVPSWSADELRDLIRRRNRQTGFEVEFDELLLDGERGGAGLELVEGADGYFRLLRETSGGNPRIATRLWLSSLSVAGEKKLRVSAFREPSTSALDDMSDDLLFALAAICQHENLSTDELRRVLNVSEGLARFAMRYLVESGLVVEKDGSADRVTLSAPLYRQTLRALRQKHLLFE